MRGGIRRYDLIHLLYEAQCWVGNEFSYFFKNLLAIRSKKTCYENGTWTNLRPTDSFTVKHEELGFI